MRCWSSMRAAEGGRHGFTLLEVLAAVALLGIAYTVLGGAGIQGLQHEGEAARRFEASLLADRVLDEIESAFDQGSAPPLGEDEQAEGDFLISIRVEPFDAVVPEREQPRALERAEDRARRPGEARRDGPDLGPSLLVGAGGQPGPLRRVEVVVAWSEGWGERRVTRTTFGLDPEAAAEVISALSAAAEAATGTGNPGAPEAPETPETPEAPPARGRR